MTDYVNLFIVAPLLEMDGLDLAKTAFEYIKATLIMRKIVSS